MATTDRPAGGFCSGTKLMTLRGEVPVESVRASDKALTLSGTDAPLKQVARVRHRRIDLTRHPAPMLAAPIRVRAGAIEDGVPLRDLRVSPDTALSVEDDNGKRVLIPALYLANGATILREPAHGAVTYVTVSLERHDILMADGMAAESGPGTADEEVTGTVVPLRPRGAPTAAAEPEAPPDYTPQPRDNLCAPLLLGEATASVHARLLARAQELGYAETDDPDLTVTTGDTVLQSLSTADGSFTYVVPPHTRELRVLSRSFVPVEAKPETGDPRRLGVAIARVLHNDVAIALDDAAFGAGFLPPEPEGAAAWRWTTGDARLTLPLHDRDTTFALHVHLGWAHYWAPPPAQPEQAAEA
jgi:hypothetical protein